MWFGKIFQISSSFNAVGRAQKEKTNDFVKQPPTPTPPPHRLFSLFLHCIPLPNSTCLPSDCDPALFQPELSAGFAWQFPPGVSSSDYNRKWSENENVTRSVSTLWFNPALTSTYLQSWDEATHRASSHFKHLQRLIKNLLYANSPSIGTSRFLTRSILLPTTMTAFVLRWPDCHRLWSKASASLRVAESVTLKTTI